MMVYPKSNETSLILLFACNSNFYQNKLGESDIVFAAPPILKDEEPPAAFNRGRFANQ
jgi:hypothetical protein